MKKNARELETLDWKFNWDRRKPIYFSNSRAIKSSYWWVDDVANAKYIYCRYGGVDHPTHLGKVECATLHRRPWL